MRFAPNPSALVSKTADEEEGGDGVYRPPKMLPTAMDYEVGGKDAKELRRNKEQRRRAGRSQLIKVRVVRHRSSRSSINACLPPGSLSVRSPGLPIFSGGKHTYQILGRVPLVSHRRTSNQEMDILFRIVSRTYTDSRAHFHRRRRNSREKSAKRPRKSGTATKTWCRARSPSARWRVWKRARAWKKICSRACRSPSKSGDDKRRRRETSIRSRRWAISGTMWRISSTARTRWTRCRESDVWWTPWRMVTRHERQTSRLANKTCRSAIPSG